MTRGPRAAAGVVSLAVAVAVILAVTMTVAVPAAVFRAVEAWDPAPVEVGLDVIEPIEAELAQMRAEAETDTRAIAFLGDSMVISYPAGRTIPDRLQQVLDRSPTGRPFQVRPVAEPGMGPFDFYFIADRVAEAGPDLVVLPFNLASFSDAWRGTFSRPQLAGWLPPRRVPQALCLPLDWIGLTADRLLAYVGVVQAGAAAPWHAFLKDQARVGRARRQLAWKIGEALGGDADARFARDGFQAASKLLQNAKTRRFTRAGVRERFGVTLDGVGPDDPVLEMLGAVVRIFRERDIPVLVYVDPLNVEHLAQVDPTEMAGSPGLDRTLESIEAVAREAGAGFADLHALLPDAGFRDGAGHLSVTKDNPDGPLHVAEALAPVVLSHAGVARAAGGD